ncbi:hypothetical protein [Kitasatospora sp. NBC_01539]|uniref:WXG100-like domain-containing protein n=1 Tax=Kitasatospora sp. NBC_01539 TaxID=2903577 RepID=UPI0038602A8D
MGVVLPDELAWVLDLIGIDWPNVDEDDYREMADSLREFAADIRDHAAESHQAVQRMMASNSGASAEAFNAHWEKLSGEHIEQLVTGCGVAAAVLDGVAVVITAAKIAAIVQLVIMAAEVIAAQAAAPFTFGLSEVAAVSATQATRVIVRRALKEAEEQIVEQLVSAATGPIISAVAGMAANLVIQLGSEAVGLGDGVDMTEVARAGEDGLRSGADDSMDQLGIGGTRTQA